MVKRPKACVQVGLPVQTISCITYTDHVALYSQQSICTDNQYRLHDTRTAGKLAGRCQLPGAAIRVLPPSNASGSTDQLESYSNRHFWLSGLGAGSGVLYTLLSNAILLQNQAESCLQPSLGWLWIAGKLLALTHIHPLHAG